MNAIPEQPVPSARAAAQPVTCPSMDCWAATSNSLTTTSAWSESEPPIQDDRRCFILRLLAPLRADAAAPRRTFNRPPGPLMAQGTYFELVAGTAISLFVRTMDSSLAVTAPVLHGCAPATWSHHPRCGTHLRQTQPRTCGLCCTDPAELCAESIRHCPASNVADADDRTTRGPLIMIRPHPPIRTGPRVPPHNRVSRARRFGPGKFAKCSSVKRRTLWETECSGPESAAANPSLDRLPRKALDQIEQALTARLDMSAVLDVIRGPEALRRRVVALIEHRVERLQNQGFVFRFDCLTHIVPPIRWQDSRSLKLRPTAHRKCSLR
jgi:hypothetical protein